MKRLHIHRFGGRKSWTGGLTSRFVRDEKHYDAAGLVHPDYFSRVYACRCGKERRRPVQKRADLWAWGY